MPTAMSLPNMSHDANVLARLWQGTRPRSPIAPVNRLALWGNVGCGKDTWAATLHFAAARAGLSLRALDEATAQWMADTRARLAFGDFPRATDVPKSPGDLKLLTFRMARATGKASTRRQGILVQIPQAAGGWWTESQKVKQLQLDTPDPYETLARSSGIICLLDPTAVDYADSALMLMTMLDYLDLYRRRLKRRHPLRIALWLSKMDHPQHRHQKGQETRYAHKLFGGRLTNFLQQYARLGDYEFRWGGCSAVGSVIHAGRLRSNAYWDYSGVDRNGNPLPVQRILDPRSIQPEDVVEPIHWVMEPLL